MAEGDNQSEQNEEPAGWQYKPEAGVSQPAPAPAAPGTGVEWTASEFIAHEKGPGWYGLYMAGVAVVCAVVYLVTREVLSAAVIAVLAIPLAISAARRPRVVPYRLDNAGVTVNTTSYPYSHYKSFAVLDEGPFIGIVLVPMKRFAFPLNIYLAPDNENQVLETIAKYLPQERGQLDAVDQLMRRVRF